MVPKPCKLPRVFAGSSAEGLEVVRIVQAELDYDAEVSIWTANFQPSRDSLSQLVEAAWNSDFGLFALTPDDKLESRGKSHLSPRDNVIFELGLFFGAVGQSRTFLITPRGGPGLKLPTDLLGITPLDYDIQKIDLRAALGPACHKMRQIIRELGILDRRLPPDAQGLLPPQH
ncbi:nucleotide-binding protein [uncultured Thiodictyon sp.]|jgi:predicted nucleotide-binding protein|uniref:nucleotide-binding protein n=1 Tax=uncultured Thiodictyon sp. TaxID=1846217 RepID=UPI003459CB78